MVIFIPDVNRRKCAGHLYLTSYIKYKILPNFHICIIIAYYRSGNIREVEPINFRVLYFARRTNSRI